MWIKIGNELFNLDKFSNIYIGENEDYEYVIQFAGNGVHSETLWSTTDKSAAVKVINQIFEIIRKGTGKTVEIEVEQEQEIEVCG